jgi:hypothetical protein
LVTGFLATATSGQMLSNAARLPQLATRSYSILMLPFGALASPRRGLCGSVGAGMVASSALSGDRRLGKTVRRQHHLPDVFAVLNEMMAAAASSKGKVRMICRMVSPETELVVAAIECPRSNASIELTFLAVTSSRLR